MKGLASLVIPALALILSPSAQAQDHYPAKPVRLIVPFLAGGAPDIVARVIAQELGARLGQPFVVENRPGAGGSLASEYVAKSAPDGYTIFATSDSPLIINPYVFKSVGYDQFKDFAPISLTAKSSFYVVGCPKLEASSLDKLMALARTRRVTYASSGYGTIMHLSGETLRERAGVELTHVPYKGAPPAMTDVMNCNVDIGFGAYGTVLPFIKVGKLKALAISSETRDPETPNVPTLAEAGYPELAQFEGYYGFLAPAGTPQAVIDLLYKNIHEILKMPSIVEGFHARAITIIDGTPKDYTERIVSGSALTQAIVKKANIQAQ